MIPLYFCFSSFLCFVSSNKAAFNSLSLNPLNRHFSNLSLLEMKKFDTNVFEKKGHWMRIKQEHKEM